MEAVDGVQGSAFELPSFQQISKDLNDKDSSIALKMSHLFALREKGGPEASRLLIQALKDRNTIDSVLFRRVQLPVAARVHEAANLLGQLGCLESVPFLERVLADYSEDEIVRHEAAEALGAIGYEQASTVLAGYLKDTSVPVQQTCELAIDFLKHKREQLENGKQKDRKSAFNTVDPLEGYEGCTVADVPRMYAVLGDKSARLWQRYRALATLRDLRIPASTAALGRVLREDDTSALLRHEIAYALGQIRFPACVAADCAATDGKEEASQPTQNGIPAGCPPLDISVDAAASEVAQALAFCLKNSKDHAMARHEAALALGSLASDERAATCTLEGKILRDAVADVLQTQLTCPDKIVAESCIVALSNMQDEWKMSFGV
ncbi:hypothetical protein Esti_006314 [Eimeria stiedai]